MSIGLIIAIISSIICFLIGIATGSSGKASETERADYAVSKAEEYKEKLDLLR